MRSAPRISAVVALFALAQPAWADEVSDFYKGKSVNIVVGHEAGTGFDIYARVLAPHLGRHIPGNPNVIVQNMVGASGITAANWLYNVAPKDGTVMATFVHTVPFEPLFGNDKAQFEPAKFAWIGNMEESVGDLRRLQGLRHRDVRRHADQGGDLRRDRRHRSARHVRAGGQEPARRQDEDGLRLQGLRRASSSRSTAARCTASAACRSPPSSRSGATNSGPASSSRSSSSAASRIADLKGIPHVDATPRPRRTARCST